MNKSALANGSQHKFYSLRTLTPSWPFKLAYINDQAHTYTRSNF